MLSSGRREVESWKAEGGLLELFFDYSRSPTAGEESERASLTSQRRIPLDEECERGRELGIVTYSTLAARKSWQVEEGRLSQEKR